MAKRGKENEIARIVDIISRVPPKSLRIVELLNEIPIVNGELDITEVEKRVDEISSAQDEARAYEQATEMSIRAIQELL